MPLLAWLQRFKNVAQVSGRLISCSDDVLKEGFMGFWLAGQPVGMANALEEKTGRNLSNFLSSAKR